MANNTVNISASNPASYLYALSVNAPDKVLFTEANIELTAKALYKKASGLNHFLAQSGVSAGDNIAIFLPRGMDAVVAVYAALMIGACYVPLDISGPKERNLFIIEDACCRAVIGNEQAPEWLTEAGITIINAEVLPSVSIQEPPVGFYDQADAPAAILYTSGSTGNPKGVVISQRAISAFVQWASHAFNLNSQDIAASLSPFHFDLSLFDLFAVPAAGANTVFIPDALKLSPSRLTDWLAENTISIWYTVPSILVFIALKGGLNKKNLFYLKQVLFAGEVFPIDSLIRLTGLLPETQFYNLFGPTETNVCLYWPVDRKRLTAGEDIPVGYPACEAELGIDPEQGELLVKGPCLMSGYWENGRCEPQLDDSGWFHTGDRVSLNSNHEYSYHGRLDRMLKCSGYRIEPAEIEQVLTAAPGVVACAIIGIADPITGTRIAAAIESEQQDRRILQLFAKKHLPAYMRPAYFHYLEKMPTLANGKKDYQRIHQEIRHQMT